MKILAVGDLIGSAGIRKLKSVLPELRKKEGIDFVIVNGENSAEGMGMTEKNFKEILEEKVDVITMGNHTWGKKDIFKFIDHPKLIRPANYTKGVVGKGYNIYSCKDKKIAVINLIGRVDMNVLSENPFVIVKEIIENDTIKIDRVYLTGTLSVVNNIDLYFQEVLQNEKVEILKPFFIKDTVKINIKDYIEVNSAISLALQGLEYGLKDMNFKKHTFKDNIDDIFAKLNISREDKTDKKQNKVLSNMFSTNFRGKLSPSERWMLRVLGGALILTVMYSGFSIFLNKEINKKNLEVAEVKQDTVYKITEVEKDIKDVQSKTSEYQRLTENLRNISNQVSENNKNRNNIPNLLSQIMHSIPQGVQITSIENPSAKHIIIQAQSQKYEQLGYFKAILKTQGILSPSTVVSSDGERSGEVVKVRIEGDLP